MIRGSERLPRRPPQLWNKADFKSEVVKHEEEIWIERHQGGIFWWPNWRRLGFVPWFCLCLPSVNSGLTSNKACDCLYLLCKHIGRGKQPPAASGDLPPRTLSPCQECEVGASQFWQAPLLSPAVQLPPSLSPGAQHTPPKARKPANALQLPIGAPSLPVQVWPPGQKLNVLDFEENMLCFPLMASLGRREIDWPFVPYSLEEITSLSWGLGQCGR